MLAYVNVCYIAQIALLCSSFSITQKARDCYIFRHRRKTQRSVSCSLSQCHKGESSYIIQGSTHRKTEVEKKRQTHTETHRHTQRNGQRKRKNVYIMKISYIKDSHEVPSTVK